MADDPLEDVLEYLARLDDGLEEGMSGAERKLVRRDVRRAIESFAFRFAFLGDRLAPADVDYARALEALKPPERAAGAVLARRDGWRRRARKAAARRLVALAVVAALVGGLAWAASSESSERLGGYVGGTEQAAFLVESANLTVPPGLDRVYVVVQPIVTSDEGTLTVSVAGPDGEPLYQRTFTRSGTNYDDANLPATPGEWRIVVDYRDVAGHARVEVFGVRAR